MERLSHKTPGYDCRKECKHPVKGDHGIHCEEWHYVVKEGDVALSLLVFSDIFPDSVDAYTHVIELPMGANFNVHVGFVVDDDDRAHKCDWVEGGTCYGSHSYGMWADSFYREHGGEKKFEQSEEFWLALEKAFREKAEEYRGMKKATPAIENPGPRIVEI